MKNLFLIVIFATYLPAQAQEVDDSLSTHIKWELVREGHPLMSSRSTDIAQAKNGDIIVVGAGSPRDKIRRDVFVISVSTSGEIQWDKTFGSNAVEKAEALATFDNGDIVVVGQRQDSNKTIVDVPWKQESLKVETGDLFYVARLDSSGKIIWEKSWAKHLRSGLRDVSTTPQGTILVVGSTALPINKPPKTGSVPADENEYIAELDGSGKIIWEKVLGGEKHDSFTSVVAKPDGGSYAIGYSLSFDTNKFVHIVNLDRNGSVIWEKRLGDMHLRPDQAAVIAKDGDLYLLGFTKKDDRPVSAMKLVRVSALGEIVWSRSYCLDRGCIPLSITTNKASGVIVSGTAKGSSYSENRPFILQVDEFSTEISLHVIEDSKAASAPSIVALSATDYVIASSERLDGAKTTNALVTRIKLK